jgi:hypothetical protein
MMHAYTTAAIINFSFSPPRDPVSHTLFMPNYVAEPSSSAEQPPAPKYTEEEIIEWQARVASLAAEMRAGHGPLLEEIKRGSDA